MLKEISSLDELYTVFPTEQSAIDHFRKVRWPSGVICYDCGSVKVWNLAGEGQKCGDCGKKFTVRHDTIFAESKLPLRKWFAAIFLITSHKKGIASAQLARDLGITQKSAWHVLHRIREATQHHAFQRPLLSGTIEADETYVGGKEKNKHRKARGRTETGEFNVAPKKIVFGMLQRGGELRMQRVKRLAETKRAVLANVELKSRVYTDEAAHYRWMTHPYEHALVRHGFHEYVVGDVTTNGIEGAFSHFKRAVIGVYHQISDEHIDRYLSMFAWRWNRKNMEEGERVNALLRSTVGHQLPYKVLTRKEEGH
jgi:transposase-like protein